MHRLVTGLTSLCCHLAAAVMETSGAVDVLVTPTVVGHVDPRFVSVAHEIGDFHFSANAWDWTSSRMRTLVSQLVPLFVRCGGTWGDGMLWADGPQTGICPTWAPPAPPRRPVKLTTALWDQFASFIDQMPGVDMAVGVNGLLRHWGDCRVLSSESCPGAIPYDPANAAAFVEHNQKMGHRVWGYEIGNEPAVWNWTFKTPIVTPAQHAADWLAFQEMLDGLYKPGDKSRPAVIGPDTTWGPYGDEQPGGGHTPTPSDYFSNILKQAPAVNVTTFHYYAIQPSLVKNYSTFVVTARDRSMCKGVAAHVKAHAASPLKGTPLWMGEGGAAFGAVGDGWLSRYGGGVSMLENLGCAATNGVSVYARYDLRDFINPKNLMPRPVYWVSLLWKKLMGNRVFQATSTDDLIHVYALESRNTSATAVLAVVNWHDATETPAEVHISVARVPCTAVSLYYLTPDASSVLSPGISLNGKVLTAGADGSAPALSPRNAQCENGRAVLRVPPLTAALVEIFSDVIAI